MVIGYFPDILGLPKMLGVRQLVKDNVKSLSTKTYLLNPEKVGFSQPLAPPISARISALRVSAKISATALLKEGKNVYN